MEAGLGSGPDLWQVGGALVAVLALLVVALKGLQRLQAAGGGDETVRMLSVRRLGPRRELQRLRVGDEVHTIYRHDGAMVVLGREPWTPSATPTGEGQAARADTPWRAPLRALVAAAGGRIRTDRPR
jgi:hypothetical protein